MSFREYVLHLLAQEHAHPTWDSTELILRVVLRYTQAGR